MESSTPEEPHPSRAWPPPAGELPVNPYLEIRDLELDRSAEATPPPEPPSFKPFKLGHEAANANPDAPRVEVTPGKAVAYDKRRAFGRTRWHEIFDPTDEDFRRRVQRSLARAAGVGAFCTLLAAASFLSFGWATFAGLAAAGAVCGVAAGAWGDHSPGWMCAMAVASFAFIPIAGGLFWLLICGGMMLLGWVAGLTREASAI